MANRFNFNLGRLSRDDAAVSDSSKNPFTVFTCRMVTKCGIWGTDLGTDYLIPLDVKQGLVGWRNKWCENKTTQFCITRSKFNRVLSDYHSGTLY